MTLSMIGSAVGGASGAGRVGEGPVVAGGLDGQNDSTAH
jgi:hypothetical protein